MPKEVARRTPRKKRGTQLKARGQTSKRRKKATKAVMYKQLGLGL